MDGQGTRLMQEDLDEEQWDPDGDDNRPALLAWIDRVKEERKTVARVSDVSADSDSVEASDTIREDVR